ncbi:hypothetical protein T4C_4707, partial [Trichinella pseudospiralis]
LRRVEGVAVEIVSDLCIDLFQLQITHKPQTGGLDDGWFWQGDDSVWENAVCIIPEHLSRHFRIYFYNTADSVVQFQRCLLFCDKLKRSGLLYKRSARFVCHQQLLCQLSPIDKVSGRCMLGADILLYEVMSACMKSMLVFLLLFFAFLCPPFWINKSSTIFNDDADLTAGSVEFCSCLIRLASSLFSDEIFTYASKQASTILFLMSCEAILISNMYYYQKFQEGNLQAEQYLLKFATENHTTMIHGLALTLISIKFILLNILLNWFAFMQLLLQSMLAVRFGVWKAASRIFIDSFFIYLFVSVVIISIVELMVMLDIVGFWFLDH